MSRIKQFLLWISSIIVSYLGGDENGGADGDRKKQLATAFNFEEAALKSIERIEKLRAVADNLIEERISKGLRKVKGRIEDNETQPSTPEEIKAQLRQQYLRR